MESAIERGAPQGKDWKVCFKEATSVIGIFFERVEEHERHTAEDAALLKKSADTLNTLKAASKEAKPKGDESTLDFEQLFKPEEDRQVKSKAKEEEEKSREVQFPSNLLKRFAEHAWAHSPNEYMAWILGTLETDTKKKKTISYAQGLYFPQQNSNMYGVWEDDGTLGDKLVKYLEDTDLVVVGWIHSHPTFAAFFSSTDCHMQYQLQTLEAKAYGLVMDSDKKVRCLRLNDKGMTALKDCKCVNWQDTGAKIFYLFGTPL